jgi:hypothetical protein
MMLGSVCSPCCAVCGRYVPRNEISASIVVPYLVSWPESLEMRSCSFSGSSLPLDGGTSPQGLGSFTMSLVGFSGLSYLYQYSRNDVYDASLAGCDQSAYQAWVNQNIFGSYPPAVYSLVSRSYFAEVRLYPLGATEFSPPASMADDRFGLVGDFCGLAEFSYTEIAVVRWSHGITATYTLSMRPVGAPAGGTGSAVTTNLAPVWPAPGNPGNVAADGVDRTQYRAWTYNPFYLLPTGNFARLPGPTSPLLGFTFMAQHQQQSFGNVFLGGTFTVTE